MSGGHRSPRVPVEPVVMLPNHSPPAGRVAEQRLPPPPVKALGGVPRSRPGFPRADLPALPRGRVDPHGPPVVGEVADSQAGGFGRGGGDGHRAVRAGVVTLRPADPARQFGAGRGGPP